MALLEVIAAICGVVSVFLSTRQNIWSWPTAIVNVALYAVVFFQGRLYGQMGLQAVYFSLSIYGWYQWRFGGRDRSALPVSRASGRLLATVFALDVVAWLALALLLRRTDAALPWLDAALTTTSLVAQWMMTRKILETWVLWIAVDLVYVPMFLTQGMVATALLYAAFLGLALLGFRDWRRSLYAREAAAA